MGTELVPRDTMELAFGVALAGVDYDRVKRLLSSNEGISDLIPSDTPPDVIWTDLQICCQIMGRSKKLIAQVKPLIGRMLVVMQNYPELYEQRGYKTFDRWMSDGMDKFFGINRAEAYQLKSIALTLPNIDPARCAELGTTKMGMIATVVAENSSNPEQIERMLTQAKTTTIANMRQGYAEQGLVNEGQLDFTILNYCITKEVKSMIDEFITRPEVHAYCGANSATAIFRRMVEECNVEWITRGAIELESNRVPE